MKPLNYTRPQIPDGQFVKGSIMGSAFVHETHKNLEVLKSGKHKKTIFAATGFPTTELDLDFLPAAAETYHLSANPEDYILVSLPIVTVDVPNRNLQAFPLEEVAHFDALQGRMVYQTFLNKPTHIDHNNADPTQAKGVHVDASMQYIPRYGLWKINVLTLWDRTKDEKLVKDILEKRRTGYSMGAMVDAFSCSICGSTDTITNPCKHMLRGKGSLWKDQNTPAHEGEKGRLCYQLCLGVSYFETSSVTEPADPTAESTDIFV